MCAPEAKQQQEQVRAPLKEQEHRASPKSRGGGGFRGGILKNPADWRCVFWIFKYFALSTLAWYYDDVVSASLPLSVLTFLVLSYYSFAGATIVHNTMHCRCFNDKNLEHAWHHLLSLTYGHPVSTFVPGHNLSHHRYPQPLA
jgi:fatty acid desaturase